ncbi:TPA: hypothetical protein MI402_08250 [Klebsiella pneumoniae]|nr:hypothetical protein [Klebsiella pneumoniae]
MRHLANNEIDSDYFAVVSECEAYGQETDVELSITEFALRAAGYVDELVEALEKAQAAQPCEHSMFWDASGVKRCSKCDLPEHANVHYADAAEMEIAALRQRIAELESRTVTVKLPNQTQFDDPLSAYEAIEKCKEALTAQGIKWEAE